MPYAFPRHTHTWIQTCILMYLNTSQNHTVCTQFYNLFLLLYYEFFTYHSLSYFTYLRFQYSTVRIWTSLVAQMVKRLPTMRRPGFDPWVRKISWSRKWQPTPVFLPGKFHGRRSLVGYSPWGRKESDTTEQLHSLTHCMDIP